MTVIIVVISLFFIFAISTMSLSLSTAVSIRHNIFFSIDPVATRCHGGKRATYHRSCPRTRLPSSNTFTYSHEYPATIGDYVELVSVQAVHLSEGYASPRSPKHAITIPTPPTLLILLLPKKKQQHNNCSPLLSLLLL